MVSFSSVTCKCKKPLSWTTHLGGGEGGNAGYSGLWEGHLNIVHFEFKDLLALLQIGLHVPHKHRLLVLHPNHLFLNHLPKIGHGYFAIVFLASNCVWENEDAISCKDDLAE